MVCYPQQLPPPSIALFILIFVESPCDALAAFDAFLDWEPLFLTTLSWAELLSQLRLKSRPHQPGTFNRYRGENKTNLYPIWSPFFHSFFLFLSRPGSLSVTILGIKGPFYRRHWPCESFWTFALLCDSQLVSHQWERNMGNMGSFEVFWFCGSIWSSLGWPCWSQDAFDLLYGTSNQIWTQTAFKDLLTLMICLLVMK